MRTASMQDKGRHRPPLRTGSSGDVGWEHSEVEDQSHEADSVRQAGARLEPEAAAEVV